MKASLAAAGFLAAAALLPAQQMPRCDLVPGWTQSGAARVYQPDTLYDYMDGNSEGYLIYGFRQMLGVTCKAGESALVLDISEMNDSESAYGLYASNRDPRQPVEPIGVSGQVVPQRGIFVKGARFIEISASPPGVDHAGEIRTFLKAMEPLLDGPTATPAPVGWFPKAGLDAASVRLIPQSVLGLSALKRGYIATYDFGRAFIARQGSPEAASAVLVKLRQRFTGAQPAQLGEEAFEGNDPYLGHLLFFRKNSWIGGFANLKDGIPFDRAAQSLFSAIQ